MSKHIVKPVNRVYSLHFFPIDSVILLVVPYDFIFPFLLFSVSLSHYLKTFFQVLEVRDNSMSHGFTLRVPFTRK